MKLYIVLIITAITMVFVTGHYALIMRGNYEISPMEQQLIQKVKDDFRNSTKNYNILNLSDLFYSEQHFQLLLPLISLTVDGQSGDKKSSFYSSDKNCFKDISRLINTENYEKVWLWEEFRCHKRELLPLDFFQRPPYVHPSGNSYAYLAWNSRHPDFSSDEWKISHIPYFHIEELSELKKDISIPEGAYLFLSQLSTEEIRALAQGKDFLINDRNILFRAQYKSIYSDLEYHIYDRKDLEKFLKGTSYSLSKKYIGRKCILEEQGYCWEFNTRHLFAMANNTGLFFFYSSLFVISIVLILLLTKITSQRKEDMRKRLALQVLTHEFRTPVASLLVLIEAINKNFDKLDHDTQDFVLRISDEIHRLNRLVQTTRNYLRLQKHGKKLVEEKPIKVESINEFIKNQLELISNDVVFHPLEKDGEFCLDVYWVGICLKNVLENAMNHGRPPFEIFLSLQSNTLDITVQDQGECPFNSLEEMSSEFIRGPKSSGTGLGLNIVKKVIEELSGELLFMKGPTRFILRLKNKKNMIKGESVLI